MSSKLFVFLLLVFSLTLVWSQSETPATSAPTSATTLATTAAPTAAPTSAPTSPSDSTVPSTEPTTEPTTELPSVPTTEPHTTVAPPFSCSSHPGIVLDLEVISGFWYDVARSANDIESSQCMRYELPSSPKDDKFEVQLEYVDTTDGNWQHAKESISLPWDDQSKNGIFTWSIGQSSNPSVTVKAVGVESQSYIFLCAYTNIAPTQMFKVLTRESEPGSEKKDFIQQQFLEFGQSSEVKWVEQSALKCNSAVRTAGGLLVALALLLLICQRNL